MQAMEKLDEHVRGRVTALADMKKQGKKLIGYSPGGYLPEDLVLAVGAVPVPLLRGGNHEAVVESSAYVPRFLDTFCRSQIGYRMLGEEPLYQMIDYLVVPVTDNNSRVIADTFCFFTDVEGFRFGVPHQKQDNGIAYYADGIKLLIEWLEQVTGNKLDEPKLRESIALSNRMWELLEKISELRKSATPPITGEEFVRLNHATFYGDKAIVVEELESIYKELKEEKGPKPRARLLVTGSTLADGDYKILALPEKTGASVVIEEFAEGMRHYWERVSLNGDVMEALVDRYFTRRVTPAWFRPSRERIDFDKKLAKDYAVDGIIHYQLLYRDGYDIQYFYYDKIMNKDMGLKTLKVESDYDNTEIVPMSTRIEAFIETIENR
jgi:benzoyl-CoA reductase/2-hydroxyglutaryl-CoA dehydratase subunit BcrC/BadD/HgdB